MGEKIQIQTPPIQGTVKDEKGEEQAVNLVLQKHLGTGTAGSARSIELTFLNDTDGGKTMKNLVLKSNTVDTNEDKILWKLGYIHSKRTGRKHKEGNDNAAPWRMHKNLDERTEKSTYSRNMHNHPVPIVQGHSTSSVSESDTLRHP